MEIHAKYYEIVNEIAGNPDVIWREVTMFRQPYRFERIKSLLDRNISGYNVAYFDATPKSSPPVPTFAVVDDDEVILASRYARLSVRHPDIVQFFSQYYEKIWSRGKSLKVGERIDHEAIREIEASF